MSGEQTMKKVRISTNRKYSKVLTEMMKLKNTISIDKHEAQNPSLED